MPPQDPNAPQPPVNPAVKPVDPASFLLPKTQTPAPAPRQNAGALLAQEQAATLLTPKPVVLQPQVAQEKVLGSPVSAGPQDAGRPDHFPAQPVAAAAIPAAAAPAKPEVPKAPESSVKSLQTYGGDIEKVVAGGTSVVSMAAAEANRRAAAGSGAEPTPDTSGKWRQYAYIAGGLVLLAAAGGVLAFIMTWTSPTVPVAQAPDAPFISVDETAVVPVPAPLARETLMLNLLKAQKETDISLGLMSWLFPARTDETGALQGLSAAQFIGALAPNAPPSLLRTLTPTYLLGVHSYDENEPFLILSVDSYGVAYAAMLEWERTLKGDLAPLFNRNPPVRAQQDIVVETASSTPQFIPTGFVDKVVENRDTRALLNAQGDLLLLWTFLGRNIILITTNDATLREVISRMNVAPTVPVPGQ